MKKLILGTILSSSFVFGCLCSGDVTGAFSNSTDGILKVLNNAQNEISSNVIPGIQKNIQDIEEQNRILEKIILTYKERNIQKKELIFLLTQLKHLQD